jgi:hypothetical protein
MHQASIGKLSLVTRLALLAAAGSIATTAYAQVGSGWTQYSASVTIQKASDPSKATYTNSGGIETFIITPGANRCEARVNNNYTSGQRQFQGEVRVSSPTNDQAVHQVFGNDQASDGSGPALMVRAFASDKSLRVGSSKVIATNIYGVWTRVNTVHVVSSSGGTIDTFVNGSRKDAGRRGGGTANHYFKYGVYGTLNTPSAKSEWRNVKFYRK